MGKKVFSGVDTLSIVGGMCPSKFLSVRYVIVFQCTSRLCDVLRCRYGVLHGYFVFVMNETKHE